MRAGMATKKNKETFEELFRRLEETVTKLEEGGLPWSAPSRSTKRA